LVLKRQVPENKPEKCAHPAISNFHADGLAEMPVIVDIMRGTAWLALLISLTVVICCVLCAIFLKERFMEGLEKRDQKQAATPKPPVSFSATIKDFFKGFWISLKFRPSPP